MSVERSLLHTLAQEAGFSSAGICAAGQPPTWHRFCEWLDRGFAGEMSYLSDRKEAYRDPDRVLEGVRTIVMLSLDYQNAPPPDVPSGFGRVSRYAWGELDYHDVIHTKLKAMKRAVLARHPGARVRGVVDTAPLLERDFARLAGLGWIGKHTLLLNRRQGSWFFLAALLTDLELAADEPFQDDFCGSCRACLDACPTDAFPQPYVLDATRCISYLTIETRGPIDVSLREGIGEWLFGCDVCQDVCPWNRKAPSSTEAAFQPRDELRPVELAELFELSDEQFRTRFRRTPLWRTRRTGILRNAAIVLGNRPHPPAIPALLRGLEDDSPTVRGACAWALGKYLPHAQVEQALKHRLDRETDAQARSEIEQSLK